uniref:endo-1,4-beta-xylanase n=1 Tax=Ningiella ruwaisensis TaxID=2364274 RepID=UPI00109FFD49|nr:endo-1,4-beta-xylanase [Ningiella ruwaisensis]
MDNLFLNKNKNQSKIRNNDKKNRKNERIKKTLLLSAMTFVLALFQVATKAEESLSTLYDHIPPDTELRIFIDETSADSLSINGEDSMVEYEWLSQQEGKFSDFVRIHVKAVGENPWSVTLKSQANSSAIKKDEWVYAGYFVRAAPGSSQVNIRGFIERATPRWMLVSDASVATGSEWTRVVAVGRAPQDFEAGSVHLSLHLAAQEQKLDVADLLFLTIDHELDAASFPATELKYAGMDKDAPWREQAQKMIDQYRTDEFTLYVVDVNGQPVKDAVVAVSREDIDFELGSMAHGLLVEDSELGEQYRLWFDQFFNYATATIYWADWGWEDPAKREEYLNKMAYFEQENIPMRGHVLLYPAFRFSPEVLNRLADDREAFIARVNQHIDEMVPILRAHGMNEYDVINELRAEKEWLDIVGLDTVVDWYKRVHALHPEAVLYINENSILTDGGDNTAQKDHYFNLITELLEKGAPIHGIGMQGHFNGIATPVEKMWEILDRFASFNLPIRITEYDTDTRDLEGQAQYDTDFYQAMYAHPNVVGITRWGFYEPVMWRPAGALINPQNELKPNALSYLSWLENLRDFEAIYKSDENGMIQYKSLYGVYRVEVNGETFSCKFTQPAYNAKKQKRSEVPACTLRMNQ